jgi:hypothetical protein
VIEITLSQFELDISDPGYQRPCIKIIPMIVKSKSMLKSVLGERAGLNLEEEDQFGSQNGNNHMGKGGHGKMSQWNQEEDDELEEGDFYSYADLQSQQVKNPHDQFYKYFN